MIIIILWGSDLEMCVKRLIRGTKHHKCSQSQTIYAHATKAKPHTPLVLFTTWYSRNITTDQSKKQLQSKIYSTRSTWSVSFQSNNTGSYHNSEAFLCNFNVLCYHSMGRIFEQFCVYMNDIICTLDGKMCWRISTFVINRNIAYSYER